MGELFNMLSHFYTQRRKRGYGRCLEQSLWDVRAEGKEAEVVLMLDYKHNAMKMTTTAFMKDSALWNI